jgi:hypothetical protein
VPSASFLVFAAAPKRLIGAVIGVHTALESNQETFDSMALTTAMARDAAGYGVPPAIIGKMVQTPAGHVEWLTPSDLALLGVTQLNAAPAPRLHPGPSAPYVASAPSVPQSAAPTPTVFQQGLHDRTAWETWFNGLTGDYQEGARYWSTQRSLPKPGSCYGAAGQSLGDWTAGCVAAQQRLGPSDVRRKIEPDFRLGWNSY